MAQQIINLGTLADGSDGDTNKTAWGKAKGNFAELYARMAGRGYIDGLQMQWVSGTALTVSSGAAYIEGAGTVLRATSAIAKTSLSLTASTWYHVYLFENSGTPDFELSTTAPAAPYNGTARSKTGDTSRRYVGSVKSDASGAIHNFLHIAASGAVIYQANISPPPFQVVSGIASSATSVSCAGVVPVTGVAASMAYSNNDDNAILLLGNSATPPSESPVAFMGQIGASLTAEGELLLDGSQAFQYMFLSPPAGNFVARVKGYRFER